MKNKYANIKENQTKKILKLHQNESLIIEIEGLPLVEAQKFVGMLSSWFQQKTRTFLVLQSPNVKLTRWVRFPKTVEIIVKGLPAEDPLKFVDGVVKPKPLANIVLTDPARLPLTQTEPEMMQVPTLMEQAEQNKQIQEALDLAKKLVKDD